MFLLEKVKSASGRFFVKESVMENSFYQHVDPFYNLFDKTVVKSIPSR